MKHQSRLSLNRLIEMHGQMTQIWEYLDGAVPLRERAPEIHMEDLESWVPDPFEPVDKAKDLIAGLILNYCPRDEVEKKLRWDFLWTWVWSVTDYDCWTKEDRAYFEARDRGIIKGASEEHAGHLSGANANNVIGLADRLPHA